MTETHLAVFKGKKIRRTLHKNGWWFSVADVVVANTLICLINQASYLLGRQLQRLEQQFLTEGGFTERLYQARNQMRNGRKKS